MKRSGLRGGVMVRGPAAGGLVGGAGLRAPTRRQSGAGPKMGSANVWAAFYRPHSAPQAPAGAAGWPLPGWAAWRGAAGPWVL